MYINVVHLNGGKVQVMTVYFSLLAVNEVIIILVFNYELYLYDRTFSLNDYW